MNLGEEIQELEEEERQLDNLIKGLTLQLEEANRKKEKVRRKADLYRELKEDMEVAGIKQLVICIGDEHTVDKRGEMETSEEELESKKEEGKLTNNSESEAETCVSTETLDLTPGQNGKEEVHQIKSSLDTRKTWGELNEEDIGDCYKNADDFDEEIETQKKMDESWRERRLISRKPIQIPRDEAVCHRCKKKGHFAYECISVQCHYCKEFGHYKKDCPRIECNLCGMRGHLGKFCANIKRIDQKYLVNQVTDDK